MDSWHATFLGLRRVPRAVTAFEIEVFFQFSAAESRIIEERRRPELIGRVAPTRTEGINLRGVFRFPVERYAEQILPSAAAEKTTVTAS